MIRFGCPACKAVMEVKDESSGSKVSCGRCGQRLRVPAPPAKTRLGVLVDAPPAAAPTDQSANLTCRKCGGKFASNRAPGQGTLRCPWCGTVGTAAPPAPLLQPIPAPVIRSKPAPSGQWTVYLIVGCCLLLGLTSLPAALASRVPLLGALMAGIGMLGGCLVVVQCLLFRHRGGGVALLVVVISLSSFASVVLLAGGFQNLTAGPKSQAGLQRPDASSGHSEVPRDQPPDMERNDTTKSKGPKSKEPTDDDPLPTPTPKKKGGPKLPDDMEKGSSKLPDDKVIKTTVGQLAQQLKSKETRINAARQLAKMGAEGRAASRAICEALLDSSEEEKQALLETFEKIHPELAKHVLTLLVDANNSHQMEAAKAVRALGNAGAAATPVLIAHARHHLSGRRVTSATFKGLPGGSYVSAGDIQALAQVAGDDTAAIDFLGEVIREAEDYNKRPGAIAACTGLRAIGKAHPKSRKSIVPHLITALADRERRLGDAQLVLGAIAALQDLEEDAKAAVPALKKLRLSSNKAVREAATEAVKRLEKDDK